MKQIDLPETIYARLQAIAIPFVDTPITVIERLLDHYELKPTVLKPNDIFGDVPTFSPENLPSLTHTKVMAAKFGDCLLENASWDSLVRTALVTARGNSDSVMDLKRISGANTVAGKKTSQGYKYLDKENFSYQGVSAEDAIKIVVRCARALSKDFSVEFVWRDKEDAFRPGERGIVLFNHAGQR